MKIGHWVVIVIFAGMATGCLINFLKSHKADRESKKLLRKNPYCRAGGIKLIESEEYLRKAEIIAVVGIVCILAAHFLLP